MNELRRMLPNEHGGYALLTIGIVAGVALGPAPGQALAVLLWLSLFLVRVPLVRLLDAKGPRQGRLEWFVTASLLLTAGASALLLWKVAPASFAWAALAALPGAIVVAMRRRQFMRSAVGEMVSALAMTPLLPSVAAAGSGAGTGILSTADLARLWLAMAIYLTGSVLRVRAISRAGRIRASERAQLAVGLMAVVAQPVATAAAWATSLLPFAVVLAALPSFAVGVVYVVAARTKRPRLMTVGIWESVTLALYSATLVWMGRGLG